MIYNEQQFESFSKPPFKYEISQVIATHTEIRTAINTFYNSREIKDKYSLSELPNVDIFLQGSYCNNTNISKASDVDIVARLDNVWRAYKATLKPDELQKYMASRKDSLYTFSSYNSDIMFCLQKHFGISYIFNDLKCLKLKNHPKYCDADIIPALTYRYYGSFPDSQNQKYDEGIVFDTNTGKEIINFPKEHQAALVWKSKKTNGNFKESVRMFKTLRDKLIDQGKLQNEIVKSYFLENLLYNVSDAKFDGTYMDRFSSILAELIHNYNNGTIANFTCANGIYKLISEHAWNMEAVKSFLIALTLIRDNNEF
jgi:hypothetical protein